MTSQRNIEIWCNGIRSFEMFGDRIEYCGKKSTRFYIATRNGKEELLKRCASCPIKNDQGVILKKITKKEAIVYEVMLS